MKFITIVLLCISQLYETNGAVQHKVLNYPGQEVIGSYEAFKDGNLTYLVCRTNNIINGKNCKIIRENTSLSNNNNKTCDVTLKLADQKGNRRKNSALMKVVSLKGNNAVIYRIVGEINATIQIYTIDLNTCKTVELDLEVKNTETPIRKLVIVAYDKSYDVIYPTTYNRFDKVSIDLKGEKIVGPVNVINSSLLQKHHPPILPVSSKTSDKGFTFLYCDEEKSNSDDCNLMVYKPNGSKTSLGRYYIVGSSFKSTAYDLIGICFIKDALQMLYRCTQYKADGRLRFRSEPVTENNRTQIIFAQNILGGGFLLLAGECKHSYENCTFEEMRVSAIKVNSVGRMVGSVDLHQFKLPARENVTLSLYRNGIMEYCASMAKFQNMNNDKKDSSSVEITTSCFKDTDFMKKKASSDDCGCDKPFYVP